MNILEAARRGETDLKENGVEDPRFNADLLLACVLGLSRERLYLERERLLTRDEQARFKKLLRRRMAREPLQYILQKQEFMGLDFYVDQRVLIPRPDSETLVEILLELNQAEEYREPPRILDVCTGSGALAIAIAHFLPRAYVTGIDISGEALKVACWNAERLGVNVDWREGDFLLPAAGEKWDWIVTNPPYVSQAVYAGCEPEIKYEPVLALVGGEDGLDFYRRLAQEVSPLLASRARILMEIGWDQAMAVQNLFKNSGFETKVFQDLGGRDRVILAR